MKYWTRDEETFGRSSNCVPKESDLGFWGKLFLKKPLDLSPISKFILLGENEAFYPFCPWMFSEHKFELCREIYTLLNLKA